MCRKPRKTVKGGAYVLWPRRRLPRRSVGAWPDAFFLAPETNDATGIRISFGCGRSAGVGMGEGRVPGDGGGGGTGRGSGRRGAGWVGKGSGEGCWDGDGSSRGVSGTGWGPVEGIGEEGVGRGEVWDEGAGPGRGGGAGEG